MKPFAKVYRAAGFAGLLALFLPVAGLGAETLEFTSSDVILRLEDLERMALQNNPTLAQAAAFTLASEGRKLQAGLYPNPKVGYLGEELSVRAPGKISEHFLFVEQSFVTAGKLGKSRNIVDQEKLQAEVESEAQKQRVLNAVRVLYVEALGIQRLVELRGELARVAGEAVEISEELFNIGQADRPDVLESEIEAQRAELDLENAMNDRERVWQLLSAVAGDPALRPTLLEGDIDGEIPVLDQEALLARLLRESPEIKTAQVGVERARATRQRAEAERIPNFSLRIGFGYSLEELSPGTRVGPEGFVELTVPLPLFDRNQGNIASARADSERAEQEVRRLELSIRARLAFAFRDYRNSRRTVERYRQEILSRAQRAYDLYLAKFLEMAAAYPQVLIAQRTLFQARVDYVQALVALRQNAIAIEGFLLAGGLTPPGEPSRGAGIEAGAMPGVGVQMEGMGQTERH